MRTYKRAQEPMIFSPAGLDVKYERTTVTKMIAHNKANNNNNNNNNKMMMKVMILNQLMTRQYD